MSSRCCASVATARSPAWPPLPYWPGTATRTPARGRAFSTFWWPPVGFGLQQAVAVAGLVGVGLLVVSVKIIAH